MTRGRKKSKAVAMPDLLTPEHEITLNKKYSTLILFFVVLVAFGIFSPALQHDYVLYDDNEYVTENPDIQNLTFENIQLFFSKAYNNTYVPLSMVSWAVEYKLFGLNPTVHILNNILLHLLNICLLFLFVRRLTRNNTLALVVSTLFALHPVHVESVAWITERKDVLYAFFYLLALIYYLKDLDSPSDNPHRYYYFLSLLFFILSILSKGQAVTLAPVLVVIDIYKRKQPFALKVILEKVPFFLLALAGGLAALHFQNLFSGNAGLYHFTFVQRLFVSSVAFCGYLFNSLFPYWLSAFYPLPSSSAPLPALYYLASLVILAYTALTLWLWKKDKLLFFALSFFLLNLILMLDHTKVGKALLADRFLYVASIGFSMGAGVLIYRLSLKYKTLALGLLLTIVVSYGIASSAYVRHFSDTKTLFASMLARYPDSPPILVNMAGVYVEEEQYQLALEYFNKSLELFPDYPDALLNRALAYFHLKDYTAAMDDINRVQQLGAEGAPEYFSTLATVQMALGKNEEALANVNIALKMDPFNFRSYGVRAKIQASGGDFQKAIDDLEFVISYNQGSERVFNDLGIIYSLSGDKTNALKNYMKSIEMKPNNPGAYFNIGIMYNSIGDTD